MFINDLFSKKLNESLRPGEYYLYKVTFDDGSTGEIEVRSEDYDIKQHYARKGKNVVKVEKIGGIHGNNFVAPAKPQQYADNSFAQAQRTYDKKIPETSDYARRRAREEEIISGQRPARKRSPAQTSDYARRREQEKKQGVAEGGFKNVTAIFSGYSNYMRSRAPNVFRQLGIKVLNKEYDEDQDIIEYTVISDRDSLDKARATLETNKQFGGMILQKKMAEGVPGETPENELERLKLRQNAEHGSASLKRQVATQARIRELEKQIKDKKGVAEGQLELTTPDPVVIVQDKSGKILDKINLSVAAQKYQLGKTDAIKKQLAHQNYTTIGDYIILSPMGGQPQDQTTQDMSEGSDISGLLAASRLNKSFIVTAETAEGQKKRFRVKAQSERVAREKFSQHHAMAKILDVKEETVSESTWNGNIVVVYDERGNLIDKMTLTSAASKYGFDAQLIKSQLKNQEHTSVRGSTGKITIGKPIVEASAQETLYKKHQELRKKSKLPDPNYYKELKATFDLPDDERWKKVAELKKKYGITEAGPFNYGVKKPRQGTVAANAEARRKQQEKNKPAIEPRDQRVGVAKVTKSTNEDIEAYLEEMSAAGYELIAENSLQCPECGGPAIDNAVLAEKQDACYHKVKSRYKVWPSAYASGALVQCRKKGAANWGNKSKK